MRDATRDLTPTLRRKIAEAWPWIWADGRRPPDIAGEPAFGVDEAPSADVDALLARLPPPP